MGSEWCDGFKSSMCDDLTELGIECWMPKCTTECSGDGKPDMGHIQDNDNDVEEIVDNGKTTNAWGSGGKVNGDCDKKKYACFDTCFVIHIRDDQWIALDQEQ